MAEQVIVRETLEVRTKAITAEDQVLAAGYADLARMVLARAKHVMVYGPDRERDLVERIVLGSMGRMAAVDSHTEIEASRTELQETMARMTRVKGHLSDVDAQALSGLLDDQDEFIDGSEV